MRGLVLALAALALPLSGCADGSPDAPQPEAGAFGAAPSEAGTNGTQPSTPPPPQPGQPGAAGAPAEAARPPRTEEVDGSFLLGTSGVGDMTTYPVEFDVEEDVTALLVELTWETGLPPYDLTLRVCLPGGDCLTDSDGGMGAPDMPARVWVPGPADGSWTTQGEASDVAADAQWTAYITWFYDEAPDEAYSAVPA